MRTSVTSSDPNRHYAKPGVSVPGRLDLQVREDIDAELAYDVDLSLVLDETRVRYVIDSVTVTRRPGGPEVTSESLRTIPLRRLVRLAVEEAGDLTEWSDKESVLVGPGEGEPFASEGPTDRNLLAAARVYLLAALSGGAPAKAVADAFKIEQRTATNWIRKARDRGYLDDPRSHEETFAEILNNPTRTAEGNTRDMDTE